MHHLPMWARKPNHKKEVVATNRGWVVKETGELLRSVKDLDVKIKALFKEAEVVVQTVEETVQTDASETVVEEAVAVPESTEESVPETPVEPTEEVKAPEPEPEPTPRKKPGRPRKNQN